MVIEPQGAGVDADWVRSLPKAEVHVHLEAAIAPDRLARLAAEAGVAVPPPFTDLPSLLDYLNFCSGLIREAADLEQLAYDFADRKHESGVRYLDIIANPTHWPHWQHRLPDFFEALDRGFARAEADGLPPAGLCISILRTQTRDEACALARTLVETAHPRVVALSIDGNEAATGRTGEKFAPAFAIARDGGFHTTAHAGESSGPEGVHDALDLLRADRIDHGVRAIDEPPLVTELAERGVPLGVAPLANVRLGMWPLEQHPVEALRRAGVRLSVNTDDPVCREFTLVDNYVRCAEVFGWSRDDVVPMVRTSIEACFAPDELKQRLLAELRALDAAGVSES